MKTMKHKTMEKLAAMIIIMTFVVVIMRLFVNFDDEDVINDLVRDKGFFFPFSFCPFFGFWQRKILR